MDILLFLKTLALISSYKVVNAGLVNDGQKENHASDGKCTSFCDSTECKEKAKTLIENMNQNMNPCNNFYEFVCGNYIKHHEIPEDKVSIGQFHAAQDRLDKKLIDTIKAETHPVDLEAFKKLKRHYRNCLDEAEIEKIGTQPLENLVNRLGSWPVLQGNEWKEKGYEWEKVMSSISQEGFHPGFPVQLYVFLDSINSQKNSLQVIIQMFPADTEINDATDDKFMEAYKTYLVGIAVLLGGDRKKANSEIKDLVDFEKKLFNAQLPGDQLADVSRLENRKKISDLSKEHPELPWLGIINRILSPSNVTVSENEFVQIHDPKFISGVGPLINSTPKRVLANYQIYNVIKGLIDFLPEEFRNLKLKFLEKQTGQKKWPKRENFCLKQVRRHFHVAISLLYVRNHFNQQSKAKVNEMIEIIREEAKTSLKKLDWMDDDTRQGALKKLEAMKTVVAYPDELLDDEKVDSFYVNLKITPGKLFDDVQNVSILAKNVHFNQLKTPARKFGWISNAGVAIVNAFYSFGKNQISIIAGILQKPFFESQWPNNLNYGGIGYVIGHEITHGFDYTGRKFDYEGNYKNWWNNKTAANFESRVQCTIDQYNDYTIKQIDKKINGKLTIGENIADANGIKLAYSAYERSIKNNGAGKECLPDLNYTPKQLFWMSAATIWCRKTTDQYLKYSTVKDPHSPAEARVNVVFSGNRDFAKDFECPIGSAMNPTVKCEVW